MDTEKNKNEELSEIAPGFPQLREFPGPPDTYFKDFPERVLNRWRHEESYPVRRRLNWKLIASVAAVFVIISSIWFIILKQNPTEPQTYTSAEAYQYVQENIDEFENLIETSEMTISEFQEPIPAAEIEEYLIEQLDQTEPEDLF